MTDLTISTNMLLTILGLLGGGGLLGLLGKLFDLKKKLDDKRDEKDCVACRDALAERIQKLSDELRERPWRSSVDEAFRAIRDLEGRVVDGEKQTLELKGDVKLVLGATSEMKAMLAQLQSDVSVIAMQ